MFESQDVKELLFGSLAKADELTILINEGLDESLRSRMDSAGESQHFSTGCDLSSDWLAAVDSPVLITIKYFYYYLSSLLVVIFIITVIIVYGQVIKIIGPIIIILIDIVFTI